MVFPAGSRSTAWTRTSLTLELALLSTAAWAGVLTAGTLIRVEAGTTRLSDPRTAALAWMLCACLGGVGIALGRRVPAVTVTSHKRPLIVLLSAALIWVLLSVMRPTFNAGDGLFAEYFPNLTWTGPPAMSVVDTDLSAARMRQRWSGMPPEQFSVRWTGFLTVGRPGLYSFATTSDDGSELIVDGRLVVDNRGMHSLATRSGSVRLDRGSHIVVVRYVQFGAASALDWSWSRDGGEYAAVPAWALSQRRTRYATVVNARIVEWGLWSFAILIVAATAWFLRAGLGGEPVSWWMADRRRDVTASYRNTASLIFSVVIYVVIVFVPWPGASGWRFFRSVGETIRDLNRTALSIPGRFEAFQANINTPRAGEYVLPTPVQEMLTMLRGHGVERYQLSDSIAADSWNLQQIVASAWPRKLEKDAKATFVLNAEPPIPGCTLIDKQRQVSLVYCP
jgi:hypothetical protein